MENLLFAVDAALVDRGKHVSIQSIFTCAETVLQTDQSTAGAHRDSLLASRSHRATRRQLDVLSDNIRHRFIAHLQASPGASVRAVAKIFGMSETTAYRIAMHQSEMSDVAAKKRGGARHVKQTVAALSAPLSWVDVQADLTLATIKARLLTEFNISITEKTVPLWLTTAGFTFKLLRLLPISRNTP
jgi:transposase